MNKVWWETMLSGCWAARLLLNWWWYACIYKLWFSGHFVPKIMNSVSSCFKLQRKTSVTLFERHGKYDMYRASDNCIFVLCVYILRRCFIESCLLSLLLWWWWWWWWCDDDDVMMMMMMMVTVTVPTRPFLILPLNCLDMWNEERMSRSTSMPCQGSVSTVLKTLVYDARNDLTCLKEFQLAPPSSLAETECRTVW